MIGEPANRRLQRHGGFNIRYAASVIANRPGRANHADAVKLLKRRIGDAAEGRPIGHDIEKTTFDDLARILLEDYQANGRRSIKRVRGAIQNLREFFSDARAIDITDDRLSSYIVYR